MSQLRIETIRRMKTLDLPAEVIDMITEDRTRIVTTDCDAKCIRDLSVLENQQLKVLMSYGGFVVYHAISYCSRGIQKRAYLVTSPFSDEWLLEFFMMDDAYSCFAYVFTEDSLVPVKEMISITPTPDGLVVTQNASAAKTTVFS